jgi:predicted phosphodiesterase
MHISDLHKSPQDSYESLYSSLVDDYNSYSSKNIQKPDVIIVSGDLIYGGSPSEIISQYAEVKEFLESLVNFFLSGNKERIVIVPGNHDIDWNISKSSMKIDQNTKENVKLLHSGIQNVRWSWSDFSFYKIIDRESYKKRLENFINFYNSFYSGVKTYSMNPDEQYQVFDLPDYDITFFAYNSCFENDHLNLSGSINPVCFSRSSALIDKFNNLGRLLIAVWHHNTTGLPNENSYMDKRILDPMADKNIKICLFGHVHSFDIINEYKNIFSNEKIILLSAVTIYGDSVSLPYGSKRQYNIIQLKFDDNNIHFSIHLREDLGKKYFPFLHGAKVKSAQVPNRHGRQ